MLEESTPSRYNPCVHNAPSASSTRDLSANARSSPPSYKIRRLVYDSRMANRRGNAAGRYHRSRIRIDSST